MNSDLQVFTASITGDQLVLMAVALCLILGAAGWWILAEPVKAIKRPAKTAKRRSAKRKKRR